MSTRTARSSKQQNERHAAILRELLKQPSNKKCADCKRNDPRWASWNLGIFICIRCSGVHRSMGTHISKVKSVDLDTWTPDQIENMKKWGNYKANLYWEANMTERDKFQESNFERWIRSKYEFKRFVKSDNVPDPDTLPNENGESKVSTSSTKQSAKPLVSTEEVQGVFSTSNNTSNKNNDNSSNSNSQDIFLFQDFTSSSSTNANNNNNNNLSTINAFNNTNTKTTPVKTNNPSNQNALKSSILSLYNSPSTAKPANTSNNFAQFDNMPLAFQATPMQPQSASSGFGSTMQPQSTNNGFGSTMQPRSTNSSFGSTMQPPMGGFNNIMQPQSTNSGFGSTMQPSNGFGSTMRPQTTSGFSSTMQPSKPAQPKHDPFDFISIYSFSNNATKTTNPPTTTSNNNNNNINANANDDFADFQTANGSSNWANF